MQRLFAPVAYERQGKIKAEASNQVRPLSSEFGLKIGVHLEVQQCLCTALWNIHQLNPVCMVSCLFSLAFSYFEISRYIVPRKWRELKETPLVWERKWLP